jgi:hypothetical protein
MNLEAVRANAAKATVEDLLDRVTVYRAGMESAALALLEQELQSRGVTDEDVQAHVEMCKNVLWERPGLAWSCAFCARPAIGCRLHWQRIFWLPLFARQVRCCREHLE